MSLQRNLAQFVLKCEDKNDLAEAAKLFAHLTLGPPIPPSSLIRIKLPKDFTVTQAKSR